MLPYNNPKILILTGTVSSAIVGASMPGAGIILSYILGVMTVPIEYLTNEDGTLTKNDYLESKMKLYAGLMALISLNAFFAGAVQKMSFGNLGENVTLKIRRILY